MSILKKMKLAANLIFIVSVLNLLNNSIQMGSECTEIKGR